MGAPRPPVEAGVERTLFLHHRGYYHVHLPMHAPPDWVTYKHILQTPGAAAWLGETAIRVKFAAAEIA